MADPLSVPCPYCGADIAKPCLRRSAWCIGTPWRIPMKRPHKARIKAAEEKSDA